MVTAPPQTYTIKVDVTGEKELQQLQTYLNQTGAAVRSFNNNTKKMAAQATGISATLQKNSYAVRQAGIQLGDFVTQVSLGQGALRAFGSQVGQVTSFMGPWGIAIGIALTAMTALIPVLMAGDEAARELAAGVERAREETARLNREARALKLGVTDEELTLIDNVADGQQRLADATRELRETEQSGRNLRPFKDRVRYAEEELERREQLLEEHRKALQAVEDENRQLEAIQKQFKKIQDAVKELTQEYIRHLELQREIEDITFSIEANQEDAAEAARLLAEQGADAALAFLDVRDRNKEIQEYAERLVESLELAEIEAYKLAINFVDAKESIAETRREAEQLRREAAEAARETEREVQAAGRRLEGVWNAVAPAANKAIGEMDQMWKDLQTIAAEPIEFAALEGLEVRDFQTALERLQVSMSQLDGVSEHTELFAQYVLAARDRTIELGQEVDKLTTELSEYGQVFQDSFTAFFDELIDGTDSVADAFSNMIESILKDIARMLLSQQVADFLGLLGATVPGFGSLTAVSTPAATRTATIQPRALNVPLAATPSTLSTPAVVRRSVRAATSSSSSTAATTANTVSVEPIININNNNGSEVSAQSNPDTGQIDIYIENKVKRLVGNGKLDKTFQVNYGIKRRA